MKTAKKTDAEISVFFLPSGEVKLQGDLETWSFFFNEFLVVFVGDEIFPGPSYVGIF